MYAGAGFWLYTDLAPGLQFMFVEINQKGVSMDTAKIYGLCLERLKHQIKLAINKEQNKGTLQDGKYMLENYCTGDIDEIIDILELYDMEERSLPSVIAKLEELAYTVSVLTREQLFFGFDRAGSLALFLRLREAEELVAGKSLSAAHAA